MTFGGARRTDGGRGNWPLRPAGPKTLRLFKLIEREAGWMRLRTTNRLEVSGGSVSISTSSNGSCLLKGNRVSHQVMWEDLQIS